jgi:2-isopropylmalate synthase
MLLAVRHKRLPDLGQALRTPRLARRLSELGHPASGAELDFLYRRFMKLAESKKTIYDQDLLSLVPLMAVSNWQLAFSFLAVWLIRWLVRA